jgi:hypothetical protein
MFVRSCASFPFFFRRETESRRRGEGADRERRRSGGRLHRRDPGQRQAVRGHRRESEEAGSNGIGVRVVVGS